MELGADGLDVHGNLFMRDHASFAGDVNLNGASVDGTLEMETASFSKTLTASRLNVHGGLFMSDHASFAGDVNLNGASIDGNLEMGTASFSKPLTASRLNVHGSLFMRDHASFAGDVNLTGASVGGNLEMETASFSKTLTASRLDVHGALLMSDHASFAGDVNLTGASVGSNVEMETASFSTLSADDLEVHGNLIMRDHASFGDVSLVGAKVGWLDLTTATATRIDLSDLTGASGAELQLRSLHWRCRQTPKGAKPPGPSAARAKPVRDDWPLGDSSWKGAKCNRDSQSPPSLILRNARIDAFQDSSDAWPPFLDLEGFHYDRIGGVNGEGTADMRQRTPEQWIDLLARDRTFSAQPYSQLAAVLTTAGRRDTAETILFAGRERERAEIWNRPDVGSWRWIGHDLPSWAWLSILSTTAGYGIGNYTFRVLWWVIGLTALGTVLLTFSPYARQHSLLWRIGASLQKLLPAVTLAEEFNAFFDRTIDPDKPPKMNRWLMGYFSVIALVGWMLGFFLLAAMGGLIQK